MVVELLEDTNSHSPLLHAAETTEDEIPQQNTTSTPAKPTSRPRRQTQSNVEDKYLQQLLELKTAKNENEKRRIDLEEIRFEAEQNYRQKRLKLEEEKLEVEKNKVVAIKNLAKILNNYDISSKP